MSFLEYSPVRAFGVWEKHLEGQGLSDEGGNGQKGNEVNEPSSAIHGVTGINTSSRNPANLRLLRLGSIFHMKLKQSCNFLIIPLYYITNINSEFII